MPTVAESGIEIAYPGDVRHTKHDAENRVWPAVDSIFDESGRSIWLEVKNWEPSGLPPRLRGPNRRSFLRSLKSGTVFKKLREKFTGTSAFLAHTGQLPTGPICFVALLESPGMDGALLLNATQRLQQIVPDQSGRSQWIRPISAVVVNLDKWNKVFPAYPARRL